jgi:two-component system, OmpR family, sensor histidine kinase CpxA
MKLRFPLFAKILLWFFLNLLLLGAVFYGFFRMQFRVGLDSLLAGQAGERVDAISRVLRDELREKPRSEWTPVLKRFSTGYGVRLSVFRFDGTQVAGEPTPLPPEVMQRLKDFRPRQPLGRPQRPMLDDEPPPPVGFDDPPPPGTPRVEPAQPRPHPKFMVHTSQPSRYWVGTPLPAGDRNRRDVMPLEALIAMSETLSGGGLFIDFTPWVLVGFGAVILSVLFWLPMIRSITRSISQVTAATEQVANGRFDIRVNDTRRDELGRLGGAINSMTGRLNGFVTGQKRFLGDVAHELCSPLARMQIALGILEERADEKQQAYVADVREEVQHMSALVNELLSFTKAGMREKEIKLQPVRLAELARRVIAREADGQVHLEIAEELQALAEPDLLTRALANLVRNAARYAGQAGPITVSARAEAGSVSLIVTDCGPGVPADSLQQIFDPFYRLESSRSADTGGIGLGLTIVKTCVEACRGTVAATNRSPTGLQVEIKLKEATG